MYLSGQETRLTCRYSGQEGRRTRRSSGRSRGDLPSKESAGTRRVCGPTRGPWKVNRAEARTRSPSARHTAVDADLRDPAAVLGHANLRAVINPGRPVCVILGAVVHFLDPEAACAVIAGYASLMAPGSCLVLSCVRFEDEELAKEYTAATWYNHSPADIVSFFDGLELAGPGVTEART
ncbi:MAG TPA: SAM-dependent methyltransferase [Streptosporangiaceae bacterium]|nr:SAM-dependent methyltransferase [Streptosporangiaceae bacterium]